MSHRLLLLAGGVLLLGPGVAPAQEGEHPAPRLEKVEKRPDRPKAAPVTQAEVRQLVKALASQDVEEREKAAKTLEDLGSGALPHLGKVLGEITEPELWDRVHRILVKLSGGRDAPRPGLTPLPPGGAPPAHLEDLFEEMEARMRRLFGELESRFERFPGIPSPTTPGGPERFHGLGRSVQVQIGPDGVDVKITRRDVSGAEEVEHYKAKDLEEFRRLYPEVARTYGIGEQGFTFRMGPQRGQTRPDEDLESLFDRLRRLFGQRGLQPRTPPWTPGLPPFLRQPQQQVPSAQPPSGERLGVFVRELSLDLSEYLGLRPGHGLLVEEVLEATLAKRAGLQARDILLSVAGRDVTGIASIQEVLGTVPGGGSVEIVVLRGGRKLELRAKKDQAPEDEGRLKPLRRA